MLKLSEAEVVAGFDLYLQSCLDRAKREKLVPSDASRFEVAPSGRALALFYASITALDAPSIPIPPASELNTYTAPPSLARFTAHWVKLSPVIQSLPTNDKLQLGRIICGLTPYALDNTLPSASTATVTPPHELNALATEFHFLALQLEQSLGLGSGSLARPVPVDVLYPMRMSNKVMASQDLPLASTLVRKKSIRRPHKLSINGIAPHSVKSSRPFVLGTASKHQHRPTASCSSYACPTISTPPTPPKHRLIIPLPVLAIRETLYVAIAEVLSSNSRLPRLFMRDPARAGFAAVCLAIVSISHSSLSSDGLSISSVFGTNISAEDVPEDDTGPEGGGYRSFIEELIAIGRQGRKMADEDDERTVACSVWGKRLPRRRIDRLGQVLERGMGYLDENGNLRVEQSRRRDYGTTMLLAFRIAKLATRVSRMASLFRNERGNDVFVGFPSHQSKFLELVL